MRSLRSVSVTVLALLFAATAAIPAGEKPILRLYAWSGFFAPDVLAQFEDENDCIIALDNFDSNEAMLESLDDYDNVFDIVTPSSYMAMEMHRRGLLEDIDHSLIPNLANIDRDFLALTEDPEMDHSIVYTRTVTGVGFNMNRLGDVSPKSWSIFGRSDLAGKLTMLDDVRESMGAALKFLGYSLNTTDEKELAEAGELLRRWRANLAKFEVDEGNIGLGSGDYLAVQGYNGDVAVLMEENDAIDFFVPEEGSAISTDVFVILKGAKNRELAHRFVNNILEPAVAARNMAEILYFMPVPEALSLLDEEVRESHFFAVPEATMAKSEVIRDLGDHTSKYEAVWRTVIE